LLNVSEKIALTKKTFLGATICAASMLAYCLRKMALTKKTILGATIFAASEMCVIERRPLFSKLLRLAQVAREET